MHASVFPEPIGPWITFASEVVSSMNRRNTSPSGRKIARPVAGSRSIINHHTDRITHNTPAIPNPTPISSETKTTAVVVITAKPQGSEKKIQTHKLNE
jgi:hypothetical protein